MAFESSGFANGFILHIINNKLAEKLFQASVVTGDNRKTFLVEFIMENNMFTLEEQIVRHIRQLLRNRKYVSVRAICIVMLSCPSLFETLFQFNKAHVNVAFYLKNLLNQDKGTTLLIEAARNNLDFAVSFLLKHGAEVDVKTDSTPLHVAARNGHHMVVDILLQHGAQMNARTDTNWTPFHVAAERGHHTVVEVLLQ